MDAVLGRLRRDRPGGPRGTRVLLACLGVAALIAVGLIAGRAGHDDQDDQAARGEASAAASVAAPASSAAAEVTMAAAGSSAAAATEAAATTAAVPELAPPTGGGRDLPVAPRISQNGAITVRVAPAELDHTIDEIGRLAEGAGGYVAGTEAELTGPAGKGRAEVTVRVPRDRYSRMVERFAGLGAVVARESTSDDLTQDYVDTESRLRHARLVEARLVALLDEATTVNQALQVQSRLDDVQLRIETDRGRLDNLTRVTDYATIAVRLVTANAAPAATVARKDDDRPWGLRDALDDAAHNLASTVGALVRGVGIALPFAVLALAIWLGVRIVRRASRRREGREGQPTAAE